MLSLSEQLLSLEQKEPLVKGLGCGVKTCDNTVLLQGTGNRVSVLG